MWLLSLFGSQSFPTGYRGFHLSNFRLFPYAV